MTARMLFVLLLSIAAVRCTDIGSPNEREPDWLRQMILEFEIAPVGNPPQSIWKYEFNGQTVYYVPPQCCDQYGFLYSAEGKILCYPDGGFSGTGDGRCPDFRQKRMNEQLIWRDPRSH